MSNNLDIPVLLTVREVSTLLRVQRPKVYELIKDGAIDGFKVGADWRIRRDSVEMLIGAIPEEFFCNSANEYDELSSDDDSFASPCVIAK
ncbi:MAG: helix-turn-helix domain-containing protein [Deltaproteobacteria bacterium]|nr:helix-turn-helix domain-containing protein [Deltaproteobacteria bacterium]